MKAAYGCFSAAQDARFQKTRYGRHEPVAERTFRERNSR